jgi:hypothetical protein
MKTKIKGFDDIVAIKGEKGAKKIFDSLQHRSLFVPTTSTYEDIAAATIPKTKWIIPGLVPQGLIVYAGKAKIGKSASALQISIAVGSGRPFIGFEVRKTGDVLYLALEDTRGRIQDRIKKQTAGVIRPPPTCHVVTEWPRVEDHGLEALERWLEQHPNTVLVIIDTLAKVRAAPKSNGHLYYDDYRAVEALKRIADKYEIGIMVIHHLRKAISDDPLDLLSGSTGLTGAADTIMVLQRERGVADGTLYITGRDVSEKNLALRFEPEILSWHLLGDAYEYRMSEERRVIVEMLREANEPLSPKDVADRLGKKQGAVRKLMLNMANQGELKNNGGAYCLVQGSIRNEKF